MSNGGVCRTAPATPGLLIISLQNQKRLCNLEICWDRVCSASDALCQWNFYSKIESLQLIFVAKDMVSLQKEKRFCDFKRYFDCIGSASNPLLSIKLNTKRYIRHLHLQLNRKYLSRHRRGFVIQRYIETKSVMLLTLFVNTISSQRDIFVIQCFT